MCVVQSSWDLDGRAKKGRRRSICLHVSRVTTHEILGLDGRTSEGSVAPKCIRHSIEG
jgi:hypothetical protein